jgi:hypothetical protein
MVSIIHNNITYTYKYEISRNGINIKLYSYDDICYDRIANK